MLFGVLGFSVLETWSMKTENNRNSLQLLLLRYYLCKTQKDTGHINTDAICVQFKFGFGNQALLRFSFFTNHSF